MRKKRNKILSTVLAGVLLAALSVGMIWQSGINASAASADGSTMDKWEDTTGQDTKNIGRIWTDKSVSTESVKLQASGAGVAPEIEIGDSDFLVALSALSSAGSITGETISTKPLDIVLVLDTSGSMSDDLGQVTVPESYDPVYGITGVYGWRNTYYAYEEGEYVELGFENFGTLDWGFTLNGERVHSKTSANDNDPSHIQFYEYTPASTQNASKMDALKIAANSFVDSTLAENREISDTNKQHRISLVTFASDANTRHELKTVDANNAAAIKASIDGLRANGSTGADYAMENTETVLEGARTDAQKVVIFFTDGEPNHGNGFNDTVANTAIGTAKSLKADNTKMYSIGMFSAANPDDTGNRFNAYMHGMSSNYPDASSYTNLGERAINADGTPTAYYKKASDSDELNKVFDEIFKDISKIEASSPFEDGTGLNGENMAAVTFHDELGDYMKVDDFKTIVFADKTFTVHSMMENPIEGEDKKIIQYVFEGTADTDNTIYPKGDLSEVIITVERFNDPAKGDKVTVTIPASMIPLREYVVDTTGEKSMTIDDTYPLRIFYGASLKDEAKTLLANPDTAMEEYIDANTNDGDQVNFYSNKYYENGENYGGVYVEFEPNDTNDFYYFQENERLYLDEECTQPATGTELDTSKTYYYDRLYYKLENGKPIEAHNIVEIPGNSNLVLAGFVESDAEGFYIPSGTPRTTSLSTHALNKDTNTTGTATYVTAPNWDDVHDPKNVIVKLGNNGLLSVDMPGELVIEKTVEVNPDTTLHPDENTEFNFDITLTGNDVKESYTAQKVDADGNEVGDAETINVTAGKASVTLKDGEKIHIYGLTAGTSYKVEEVNIPDGFTVKKNENAEGTITSGQTVASFTNEYTVEDLIIQAEDFGLKGNKTITGRTFEEGDIFKFDITASDVAPDSPIPDPASTIIEITDGSGDVGKDSKEISFGEFTFKEEGHYRYSIKEYLPTGNGNEAYDKIMPGVTYDTTNYRLTLDVKDNGNGELYVTNVHIDKNSGKAADNQWTPVYPADGADGAGLPENDASFLAFTNTYVEKQQTVSLVARKELNKLFTDYALSEQFGFIVEAGGERTDENADFEIKADDPQPMPEDTDGKYIYRNDTTGVITIPDITFTHSDAQDDGSVIEYLYKIRELQPTEDGAFEGTGIEGATKVDGKWTYKGITFDNEVKEIKIKVSSERQMVGGVETEVVVVTIDYGTDNNQLTPFKNTYNASVEKADITGTKKITGRDFNGTETFTFNITAENGAPLPVDGNNNPLSSVRITPTAGTNEAAINFGTFKFTEKDMMTGATIDRNADGHATYTKTFEYTITEEKGADEAIAYDTAVRNLSITVKDDGYGNMTIEQTEMTPVTDGKFVWENKYSASMTYSSGINVQKTLTGRAMKAGEFDFTITPLNDTPAIDGADAKFKNGASAAGTPYVMNKLSTLKFTQNDADKTFTYIIDETEPATAAGNGVTYDKSQYKVEITPADNGDGTMTATTTVYRTMTADGTVVDPATPLGADEKIAFNNSYEAGPGTLPGAANLEVTKNFTGRENDQWLDSDVFTFELMLDVESLPAGATADDVIMPADTEITIDAADPDKKASFGDIIFKKPGTYKFAVIEKQDGLADKGITGDEGVRIITILVTDPGTGTLAATKDASSDALYFTNTYSTTDVTFAGINVEKTLPDERGWKDTDSFTFKLEGNDEHDATMEAIEAGDVVLPNTTTITIPATDDDHMMAFDAITFKKVGEYSFKVTEEEGKIAGIGYDTTERIVNVVVTDNNAGELVVQVKNADGLTTDSTTVTVANSYTPDGADPVSTTGLFTKVIDGRDWLDTDEFTFKITAENGAPASEKTEVTVKKTDVKDGKAAFDFGEITFTPDLMTDDAGNRVMTKEFTYTVREDKGGTTENGLTYSDNVATMMIKVTDDGSGKLTAETPKITAGSAEFVNTYRASLDYGAIGGLTVTKTLNGIDMADGKFTFTITPDDDASKTKLGITDTTLTAGASAEGVKATVETFNSITFDQSDVGKTYGFTLTENKGGTTEDGYTYDDTEYVVKIAVSDNSDGTLTAKTTVNGDEKASWTTGMAAADPIELAFKNIYTTTPTSALEVGITKKVSGHAAADKQFTFTMAAADDDTKNAIAKGVITGGTWDLTNYSMTAEAGAIDDGKAADVKFAGLTFNATGTYTFNVTENDLAASGWTYDDHTCVVKVEVKDEKSQLEAHATYEGGEIFTNTYSASTDVDDIAALIDATKKLTGRDMAADEFSFEVVTRAAENTEGFTGTVVATGTNAAATAGAAGDVAFTGPIKYTLDSLAGAATGNYATKDVVDGKPTWTLYYTARELTNALPGGVTGVTTTVDFTITVTDNGNGTLSAVVNHPEGGIAFENKYKTGGTKVDTDASAFFYKVLEGREWLDTDKFTFTIEPQDGAPAPVDEDGNVVTEVTVTGVKDGKVPFGFGTITFTDDDMAGDTTKEFTYLVEEKASGIAGVADDTHTAKLTIRLTDDGKGNLVAATPEVTGGTFTNKYTSSLDYTALGGLQITKILNGRDLEENQFTFTVTPEATEATEGNTTVDDAAAKLGLSATAKNEFQNPAAQMGAAATINVLDRKNVIFTQADDGKIYTYKVAEVNDAKDGYSYDTDVRTVTIAVVDNNNATITVTTTVTLSDGTVVDQQVITTGDTDKKQATVAFANTYNDVPAILGGEGSVAINARKTLTNRPLTDGEFTFNVFDKNNGVVTTGLNNAEGNITFNPVEYTTDKLNADVASGIASVDKAAQYPKYIYTYEYTVVEDAAGLVDGVAGVTTEFKIKVVVTDNANGKLDIAVQYPADANELVFENTYGASANAEISLKGQKNYVVESGDNAPDITGAYQFTISGSEGAPMPENTTVSNDAAGNVDFGKITYTMENVFADVEAIEEPVEQTVEDAVDETGVEGTDEGAGTDVAGATAEIAEATDDDIMTMSAPRTKTFTYTVTESGGVEGVVNDPETVKTFTVTVTDNGDGTISVKKDWGEGFAFTFTNTYKVTPIDYSISTDITVQKNLTGRDLNEGEFEFELVDKDGNVVAAANNAADGTVTFPAVNYTKPGEYNYTVREKNNALGGVDYDTKSYEVTVEVVDNGNGTLSAGATANTEDEKTIVFENVYVAQGTSVTFGASKVYKDGELKDGQFTFELKDEKGTVIAEAKNKGNGQVVFDTVEFDKVGTYKYTISEVNDKQANVTYDKTVYAVTVTVTDDLKGYLNAEVTYEDGKVPVFTNKYTKPEEPKPEEPKPEESKKPAAIKTGDEANVAGIACIAILAIGAAAGAVVYRRKRLK